MFKFASKGSTLLALKGLVVRSEILPLILVDQESSPLTAALCHSLRQRFAQPVGHVIVRSSFVQEDQSDQSGAGRFLSIADVDFNDDHQLIGAMERVIASQENSEQWQILLQPMLKNVSCSGVILSRDYATGAPYITINYDESGSLNSITAGSGNHKSLVVLPNAQNVPAWVKPLLLMLKELQEVTEEDALDIEFALRPESSLPLLLQVRPMVKVKHITADDEFLQGIDCLHKSLKRAFQNNPNLLGTDAIYGIMPDWNPAEMIGIRPHPLALSLYRELITDSVWAYQRDNYGYRNLRSCPLLMSFAGMPYIDVRASFNSFIPKALNQSIATRLVDYYLKSLKRSPGLHDKVEFAIVFSCYTFDLPDRLRILEQEGFNQNELRRLEFALLELTNSILDPDKGLCGKDLQKIQRLEELHTRVLQSQASWSTKLFWLIEYTKRYGTLPFAGIARAAFVAIQLLQSLKNAKVFDAEQYELFLGSLNTVSRRLAKDLEMMMDKRLSQEEFLTVYGHLRPGTYDIYSPRYDEAFDLYFRQAGPSLKEDTQSHSVFSLTPGCEREVDRLCQEMGLRTTCRQLLSFCRQAIEGRELAKFVFTRSLSAVLQLIRQNAAGEYGLKDEDLGFLDISFYLSRYSTFNSRDEKALAQERVLANRLQYEFTSRLQLPSLIVDADEVYCFHVGADEPNFVSSAVVLADVVHESEIDTLDCSGRIVLIRAADPGYDYLFSRNIGGLITMYGGANSHMAIRCAELGLPAVIGAGEVLFSSLGRARRILIDGLKRKVQVVS